MPAKGEYQRSNGAWVKLGQGAVSTVQDITPPTAPPNLRVTSKTQTSITLAWNASFDLVGVVGYDVKRGTSPAVSVSSSTLTYQFTGLTASTSYTFTVTSRDAAGNTGVSTITDTTSNPVTVNNGTVWGAAITTTPGTNQSNPAALTDHEARVGKVGVYRTYSTTGFSTDWTGTPNALNGNWQTRWSYVSFKPDVLAVASGSQDSLILGWLNSIPVTGYKRLLSCWHEPYDNFSKGGIGKESQWFNMAYRVGELVRQAKHPDVLYGPTLTSAFTVGNGGEAAMVTAGGTRNLNDVCDFIGFDPYHEYSRNAPYRSDGLTNPTYNGTNNAAGLTRWFTPLSNFRDQYFPSKPLAFGEIGACNDDSLPVGSKRAAWLADVENWCNTHNVLACCYYDSTAGQPVFIRIDSRDHPVNMGITYPDDPTSRAGLSAVYSRNPAFVS